ncbi:fluoride efflux transporter CrcB [Calorimonas adulescens]|uniref:Fluoride-specific ion channel FluC n=1 Tax=Calorimonas adulescens TaxID=2606906 RepID=A0A5D8QA22_9THEO|nr:fluoride efflux transporter CrcB [Calorimonas adulescens]
MITPITARAIIGVYLFLSERGYDLGRVLLVGIGGFIGSILRYLISGWAETYFSSNIPMGTLLVNVSGCFLIGFIMEAATAVFPLSAELRIFLTTGFMGGFTTFSTLSYETAIMLSDGSNVLALINILLNIGLGITAVWLGRICAQILA